jgi:hypothetical protein
LCFLFTQPTCRQFIVKRLRHKRLLQCAELLTFVQMVHAGWQWHAGNVAAGAFSAGGAIIGEGTAVELFRADPVAAKSAAKGSHE